MRNHPENRGWNETLRLDYLNHRVDKETFILRLKKRMKSQWLDQEKIRIYSSFIQQGKQIMYDYYQQVYQFLQGMPKKRSRSEVIREQMDYLVVITTMYEKMELLIGQNIQSHNQGLDELYEMHAVKNPRHRLYFLYFHADSHIVFTHMG